MSLPNPNLPVTEARLQEFYHRIKSYLGFTEMPSEDMSEVISPLPSIQPRYYKYSTEEHIVGEWIDGSKVYEKTIDCGALPNNTSKAVTIGVSNIDKIISVNGIALNSANESLPLPYYHPASGVVMDVRSGSIFFGTKTNMSDATAIVTIQYTKSE